jgi:hypothetical protein
MANLIETLKRAGFKGEALKTAWAVAMRESGGNAEAYNPNRATGDDSHGLFQINMLGAMGDDRDKKFRQHVPGYRNRESLMDPVVNARAAFYMTNKGTNWKHWDIDSSGYNGGANAGKYREWLAKFPEGEAVGLDKKQKANAARLAGQSLLTRSADGSSSWAVKSTRGSQTWSNLCDRYVANAYGQAHSGYETALHHWAATPTNMRHEGDDQPPVGALVFWETGKPAGHVAIVTGYDRKGNALITTTHTNGGKPTTMKLSAAGMTYKGWAVPYFQGRVAELDDNSTGYATREDQYRAGDMSGIDSRDAGSIRWANGQPGNYNGFGRDDLSQEELAREYGFAEKLIYAVPQLADIFEQAAAEDWQPAKIDAEIQSTEWFAKNNQYAREAIMASSLDDADWRSYQSDARVAVQAAATAQGAKLSKLQEDALVNQYLFEGWGKRKGGMQMLKTALADDNLNAMTVASEKHPGAGFMSGDAGDLQQTLSLLADKNGVKLSNGYFEQAAKSVAKGLTTNEDWERDIRTQAASAWPGYSDKIMAGSNVSDLVSAYTKSMADIWEIDPDTIDLNNPEFKKSLMRTDDKGNLVPMGLYEFEQELRKSPKWLETKNATDKISSVASDVARIFGFTG